MKNATELLMRIIAHENKYVETMRHTRKKGELAMLRLQNKSRALEIEIEEHKQLIEEYRGYLKDTSEADYIGMKLVHSTKRQMYSKLSTTQSELIKSLEE